MRRPRFWQKVLAALLFVGVVPTALVSALSISSTRHDLTALGVSNILQRSISTASAIDAYLRSRLGDIELVATLPDVVRYAQDPRSDSARGAVKTALAVAARRAPEYESVAVVASDGTIIAASATGDEGTNVRFREYFTSALRGTPFISDPSYSVITRRPALFFSAPITDGKVVLAVARTRVSLGAIWDVVESDSGSVGVGAHGLLLDDHGIRLAASETKGRRESAESLIYRPIAPLDGPTVRMLSADKRFGDRTQPGDLVVDPLPTLQAALGALPQGSRTSAQFSYGAGSAEQRGVVTRLLAKPWVYVLAVPLTTYTRVADDATSNALAVAAIALLLSLGIGVLLTRSLVHPLRQLAGEATAVSTGDVDLRAASFGTRAGDDITAEVAAAFDRMLSALRFYALTDDASVGEE